MATELYAIFVDGLFWLSIDEHGKISLCCSGNDAFCGFREYCNTAIELAIKAGYNPKSFSLLRITQ